MNQMSVAMEAEDQTAGGSSSSTPDVSPPENRSNFLSYHPPRLCTVIPNRIFVGGIDYTVSESDLQHVFSQHGAVKEVKIVTDRSGISKGYGFVTFETQDDVLKILHDANGICFKDKKLSIGQAFRKQQGSVQIKSTHVVVPASAVPAPMSCGTVYLTTSAGNPYTYHNGVAYFHCPSVNPPAPRWPPAPPVILPRSNQPVYQQPAFHNYQCVPNQHQCNVVQPPVPSNPAVHPQQTDYLYQPTDGGSAQPPLPVMEEPAPEFVEPPVQQLYPLYPQGTGGMAPIALQHDPGRNPMFPHPQVHQKPKYRRCVHHQDCHYLSEATEPPDASALHTAPPLM